MEEPKEAPPEYLNRETAKVLRRQRSKRSSDERAIEELAGGKHGPISEEDEPISELAELFLKKTDRPRRLWEQLWRRRETFTPGGQSFAERGKLAPSGDPARKNVEHVPTRDQASERQAYVETKAKFIAQLARKAGQLRAAGEASAYRLRQFWVSRTVGPTYAADPLAAVRSEPRDRSGRRLPWRWERSLSRDLLGHYGLVAAGAAVVIAAIASIVPPPPMVPVDRAGPIVKSAVPPQNQPSAPQMPRAHARTPQEAPKLPRPLTPQKSQVSAAPSSTSAASKEPLSKLGPQQQSSTGAGKTAK